MGLFVSLIKPWDKPLGLFVSLISFATTRNPETSSRSGDLRRQTNEFIGWLVLLLCWSLGVLCRRLGKLWEVAHGASLCGARRAPNLLSRPWRFSPPLFVLSPAALNGPRLSCPWHNHLQCFGISGGGLSLAWRLLYLLGFT